MNDVIDNKAIEASSLRLIKTCTAQQLNDVAKTYFPNIGCLSLDCFDTIIWRKVAEPTDVFYLFTKEPHFKKLGISPELRAKLEIIARRRKKITHQTEEVTLKEIYQAYSHNLSEVEIDQLIESEIKAELAHTFAFGPMVELMQLAVDQGKKIIVVSDTYFTQEQVKRLLSAHLPAHIVDQIEIYASCEQSKNKVSGVHLDILTKLRIKPDQCLHIGDNQVADYTAPKALGLHAVHFTPHPLAIKKMYSMRDLGISLVAPTVRSTEPLYRPYYDLLAKNEFSDDKPEKLIGYISLGPLMYAFAQYIYQEVKKLEQVNSNVKVLFLLRDAYLPQKIMNIVAPDLKTYAVRISRYASYAASFSSKQSIIDYVASVISGDRYEDICKQLQFPFHKVEADLKKANSKKAKRHVLTEKLLSNDSVKIIIDNSKKYQARLMRYLKKQVNAEPGDTLMFVDLGYSGTTQTQLAPGFATDFNINIVGRYLISLNTPEWLSSRAGLLDPSNCDDRLLLTLVSYVALLEQLCTTVDSSVIDFDQDGEPIFSEANLNADQHDKLVKIQQQCEQFALDAKQQVGSDGGMSPEVLYQSALAELIRLLYFPTKIEMDYLQTFKFDLNLGTKDVFEMFDANKGLLELQRRGLFFMEKQSKTMRTNYPAELRANALELSITLLAQHRYNLAFSVQDMSFRTATVPIYVIQGNKHARHMVQACSTHDGYFSLVIPLGTGQYITGVALGEVYKWVQIKAFEVIPVKSIYTDFESADTLDISADVVYDQLNHHGQGLYECISTASLALLQPVSQACNDNMVCRMTFRPIVTHSI